MKQWKIPTLCNLGVILLYVVYLILVALDMGEGNTIAGVLSGAIEDLFIVILSFQAVSGVYFYGKTGALKSLVDHLRRQFLLMLPMGVLSVIILGVPLFMWSSHLSMPVFDALVGGVVFVVCSYIYSSSLYLTSAYAYAIIRISFSTRF